MDAEMEKELLAFFLFEGLIGKTYKKLQDIADMKSKKACLGVMFIQRHYKERESVMFINTSLWQGDQMFHS